MGQLQGTDPLPAQLVDGALILRNTPDMIRECLAFVEAQKTRRHGAVAFRADLFTLPAKAAEALPDPSAFIDGAQADALRAAAGPSHERLAWQAQEGQRSSLEWDRALDYLYDVEDKGATIHSIHTKSMIELRAAGDRDATSVALDLRVKDQRVSAIFEAPAKANGIELPVLALHDVTTSISLPAGKTAVFRWALPEKAGEERQVRVLLLQASALPDLK